MWFFDKHKQISDTKIFNGITDFHSHLLPGVDDGVKVIEESLKILSAMEKAGYKTLWLTPHIMEDYPNETVDLKKKFAFVQENYKGPIHLHLAAEYMMDNLFHKRLEQDDLLTIGYDNNMVLVETSYYNPPMDLYQLLEQIKKQGYYPLLAHPERYRYMQWKDYVYLKEHQIRLQLNIPSLTGFYGKEAKEKAEKLLENNFYDFAGNDIHSFKYFNIIMESKINTKWLPKIPILTDSAN